jgi:hypothetical protein
MGAVEYTKRYQRSHYDCAVEAYSRARKALGEQAIIIVETIIDDDLQTTEPLAKLIAEYRALGDAHDRAERERDAAYAALEEVWGRVE